MRSTFTGRYEATHCSVYEYTVEWRWQGRKVHWEATAHCIESGAVGFISRDLEDVPADADLAPLIAPLLELELDRFEGWPGVDRQR